MTVTHQPPWDFAHLVEVESMLVTSDVEDMTLTLASIERYSHGFVLVLWSSTREHAPGLLAITAIDDSGQPYSGKMLAGHGSGRADIGWNNRIVYSFTPVLHPNAQTLTLDVTNVRKMGFSPEQKQVIDPADVVGGPWSFTFDLAKARSHTEHAMLSTDRQRPPKLRPATLSRVIPVAQHQEVNGLAITLMSLETYSDGFSLVVRTDFAEPFVMFTHRFNWQVTDSHGSSYYPWQHGGSGGGIPGKTTAWRIDCPFTPALKSDTAELRLRLDEVEISRSGGERSTLHGPWEFVIQL